jgi:hypothetical protein
MEAPPKSNGERDILLTRFEPGQLHYHLHSRPICQCGGDATTPLRPGLFCSSLVTSSGLDKLAGCSGFRIADGLTALWVVWGCQAA